jgi:glycosyltransferase involved in cell wall biosynthesis
MDICLNLFTKIPVSHRACPIKLFEYLSQKKPVITTRLDELEHIDDGFLYYGDNLDEVVAQIRAILNDRAGAESAAQRGYQLTASQYTWDRIAGRFAALVSERLPRTA